MPQVIRSIEIHATPTTVWSWLATQEALRHWISPNIDIDLRVGGEYRFLGPDDKTMDQRHRAGTVAREKPDPVLA